MAQVDRRADVIGFPMGAAGEFPYRLNTLISLARDWFVTGVRRRRWQSELNGLEMRQLVDTGIDPQRAGKDRALPVSPAIAALVWMR